MEIQVSDKCNPSLCKLECIESCQEIHGDAPPLSLNDTRTHVIVNQSNCTGCLACIRACPFGALTVTRIPQENGEELADTSDSKEGPYEVADDYSLMSEADTIFARVQFDPDYEYYQMTEFSGAEFMISTGTPGYGRFEHELSVAAWKLYDSRHSIKRPGIGLDPNAIESGKRVESNPEELTEMVKKAAKFFGANLVGITKLNRNWLYTVNRRGEPYDVPESITHAVVMAIEMDYDAISTSPAYTSSAATGLGYSLMAFVELELASFIKRLGFDAITCGNDVGLSVPMAIDAGLGQYGRHGLLITKKYGPRVRIAKVLTDMPLVADVPDLEFCESVVRFCETCEKCATNCPSQSIPFGKSRTWSGLTKSNNHGTKKWYVDVESCYGFWTENGSECSNCIRSCPYNKEDGLQHRIVLWMVQHTPWLNRLVVKLDDLLGYGKQKDSSKFWRSIHKT